jgi:DNA-binding GntR family transcriptional regulator
MTVEDSAPPTRAGVVAEKLRRLIQSGEIAPGSRLRQNEVAERFGVSTTPVREAFAELARDGIVRQDAHRGATVFRPSVEEIIEIYKIRGALEPMATELAVAHATEQDIVDLEQILEEMKKTDDPARYVELNHLFHARIYDMSGKPRLASIVAGLRKTSANYINLTVPNPDKDYADQVHAQHEEILEALRNRQAERAARAVRTHLQTTVKHVTSLMTHESQPASKTEGTHADRPSSPPGHDQPTR